MQIFVLIFALILQYTNSQTQKHTNKMAKYFKNTHTHHILAQNGNRTKCGIRVSEFTDIINEDGFIVSATKHRTFEPYKSEFATTCKKCNQN